MRDNKQNIRPRDDVSEFEDMCHSAVLFTTPLHIRQKGDLSRVAVQERVQDAVAREAVLTCNGKHVVCVIR